MPSRRSRQQARHPSALGRPAGLRRGLAGSSRQASDPGVLVSLRAERTSRRKRGPVMRRPPTEAAYRSRDSAISIRALVSAITALDRSIAARISARARLDAVTSSPVDRSCAAIATVCVVKPLSGVRQVFIPAPHEDPEFALVPAARLRAVSIALDGLGPQFARRARHCGAPNSQEAGARAVSQPPTPDDRCR
jgi:hypothetical protein